MPDARLTHASIRLANGGSEVLLLASSPISWTITPGVNPSQGLFPISVTSAPDVEAMKGRSVELVIGVQGQDQTSLVVRNLSVLDILGTESPFIRHVLLADRRWKWPSSHVKRAYNMRRRIGARRVVQKDEMGNVDSFLVTGYAKFSLFARVRPWKADEILRSVMLAVEPDLLDVDIPGGLLDKVNVDSLIIDDAGDSAVAQVLSFLPGMSCFVNTEGRVAFFNQLDGGENVERNRFGHPIVDEGYPVRVAHDAIRPEFVEVLFNREYELRLDSVEGLAGGGIVALENVLPLPDQTLLVEGQQLSAGTYVPIETAINAWNADLVTPPINGPLTLDIIRRLWFDGLWAQKAVFGLNFLDPKVPVWNARFGAVMAHYRQTYRITRDVMDSLYSIQANRVAIVDPARGTRAPSLAWSDYCVIPSTYGQFLTDQTSYYGVSIRGYSARLSSGHICPINVSILDDQLGIVRLGYRTDAFGHIGGVVPSFVDNVAVAAPKAEKPRWWYEAFPGGINGGRPQLSATHGVAVVLTAAPAAPNTTDQLERIYISPGEAKETLGANGINVDLSKCNGPRLQIRVGPQYATARYGWIDTQEHVDAVRLALGLDGEPEPIALRGWINEDDCREVARAMAAVAYAGLIDRFQGSKAVYLNPAQQIGGTMSSVTHTLAPDGKASTSYTLPATMPAKRNFLSLLPPSVRAIVARMVQP